MLFATDNPFNELEFIVLVDTELPFAPVIEIPLPPLLEILLFDKILFSAPDATEIPSPIEFEIVLVVILLPEEFNRDSGDLICEDVISASIRKC